MPKENNWLSPAGGQRLTGFAAHSLRTVCIKNPGFGLRINGRWKIPHRHLLLLVAGVDAAEIARRAREATAA